MSILDGMFEDDSKYGINIGDYEYDRTDFEEIIEEDFEDGEYAYIWVAPFCMLHYMSEDDIKTFLKTKDKNEALKKIFLKELKKELEEYR